MSKVVKETKSERISFRVTPTYLSKIGEVLNEVSGEREKEYKVSEYILDLINKDLNTRGKITLGGNE